MSRFATGLVGLFIRLAVVSAGKSIMTIKIPRESWITMENLTTLLELSFNASKCCNVFISGESIETENIFNQFAKMYKHEYVINNRTYVCNGYFMISDRVDRLVDGIKNSPTTIATTEMLIIVDKNIDETSALFDVSMYENANVNVVGPNGMWRLSDSSYRPRVFEKHLKHNEMAHKRGIKNFGGRELRGAAITQAPWCYLQKTFNRTVNGIEAEFFDVKNKSELDGIEMKLFMLIAERLNFTWNLRKPDSFDRYGHANATHWTGGLVGLLFSKEVDIAFGSIWLTNWSYHFTDLTAPTAQMAVHFLVPRPKPLTSFWALTRPLSIEVWIGLFAMLMLQSIYVYTSSRISPRITRSKEFKNISSE